MIIKRQEDEDMRYDGVYSCGHEGSIHLYGKSDYREWRKEKIFSGICPECYKKQLAEERAVEKEAAIEEAKEMQLPELTGTEKQIAWAITIRSNLIKELSTFFTNAGEKVRVEDKKLVSIDELSEAFDFILETKTSAKFWIDNRSSYDCKKKILEAYNEMKSEESIPEDVKEELTVVPNRAEKSGVVKITCEDNVIKAEYVRDDNFIKIVKSKGYKWNGSFWGYQITDTSGKMVDRLSDIGNALLANGFTVRFPDIESKEAALNGSFEQLHDNWITWSEKKLLIKWKGMNDDFYKKAKKLPGAKWNSGAMQVSVEYYKEVEEFADVLGFKFSESAKKEIEKYKEKEGHYEKKSVTEAVPEESASVDRLKEILEKDGVIEDLIDD